MPTNQNDVADRLKEHRQQMDAWKQQQATFQERLEMFHRRQQDLREHLETVRGDMEYLEMLKQMKSQKRLERPLAKLIRL
jgi:predicted  nucleic acid-binding Zn-ribbon protein